MNYLPLGRMLRSRGRGRNYSALRGLSELTLRALYSGDWPARLWQRVPFKSGLEVVRLDLPVLRNGSTPLRLAFASDLHIGPTTPDALLDVAFAELSAARPDVLVLGGDYVFLDATPERADRLRSLVRSVRARSKFAVLGNHDLWTEHERLETALREAGATLLVNARAPLPAPHDDIWLIGVDEPWTGTPDVEQALAACPAHATRLLVCHSPDGFLAAPRGIALYIAGHTHGGQIALPGGVPIVLPPGPGSRRWPRGVHRYGDGIVYVSKGIGATELPVRAFARPEVALLTLTGSS